VTSVVLGCPHPRLSLNSKRATAIEIGAEIFLVQGTPKRDREPLSGRRAACFYGPTRMLHVHRLGRRGAMICITDAIQHLWPVLLAIVVAINLMFGLGSSPFWDAL